MKASFKYISYNKDDAMNILEKIIIGLDTQINIMNQFYKIL